MSGRRCRHCCYGVVCPSYIYEGCINSDFNLCIQFGLIGIYIKDEDIQSSSL